MPCLRAKHGDMKTCGSPCTLHADTVEIRNLTLFYHDNASQPPLTTQLPTPQTMRKLQLRKWEDPEVPGVACCGPQQPSGAKSPHSAAS